jgi:hypothetical protein
VPSQNETKGLRNQDVRGVAHGVEAAHGEECEGGEEGWCEEVAGGEWREKKNNEEKTMKQRR